MPPQYACLSSDLVIYPSLDDFLRTLPPLSSNPPDERKAFLVHFEYEVGFVPSQILLDVANHVMKFGIPSADSLALGISLTMPKDVAINSNSDVDGIDTTSSWAPRAKSPAFAVPVPRPQSVQVPSQPRSSQPSVQQRGSSITEDPISPAKNADLWDFEAGFDVGSLSDFMKVSQKVEPAPIPVTMPGATRSTTGKNVGSGVFPTSHRPMKPVTAPMSRSTSIQSPLLQSTPFHGSSVVDLNAHQDTPSAHTKMPVAKPILERRPSNTPASTTPSQPTNMATGVGGSGKSSKKRKGIDSVQRGGTKKSKEQEYCPYCKKWFDKDLKRHIIDNVKCDNKDKLAIYNGQGSLIPHASPNLNLPKASTKAPKPALSQECMVLIPAMVAPGGKLLRDSNSGYVHMQYGAPRR